VRHKMPEEVIKVGLLVAVVMLSRPGNALSGVRERTQKTLEVGLKGLRASARDLYRKNDLLRKENRRLEERLRFYQSRLETLIGEASVEKSRISRSRNDIEGDQIRSLRGSKRRLEARLYQLKEQERLLERDIALKESRTRQVRQRVEAIQGESARVKEKITGLEVSWKGFGESKERARLRREMAVKEERVDQLKRRFKRIQNKNKAPKALLDGLRAKNALLREQVNTLDQEIAVADAQIKGLGQEIQELKRGAEKEALQLQRKIDQLTLRRQELSLTLKKARKKLKERGVRLKVNVAEEIRLKENITALRKEHEVLMKEVSALEKKIATMDER